MHKNSLSEIRISTFTGVGILVRKGKKFLFIKRGKEPFQGFWTLPGGEQDPGETAEEAAHRELREETRLFADTLNFLTIFEQESHDVSSGHSVHVKLSIFLAKSVSGSPQAMDDAENLNWFSLDEIPELNTTPGLEELLHKVAPQITQS